MIRIVIRTKLLSLNDALALAMSALKRNKSTWSRGRKKTAYKGSQYSLAKKALTQSVGAEAMQQSEALENTCYTLFFEWYLPDFRKDPDNVYHGTKYALDGLVGADILLNDGFKHTGGGHIHTFFKDAKDPRLEIYFVKGNFNEKLRQLKHEI